MPEIPTIPTVKMNSEGYLIVTFSSSVQFPSYLLKSVN